MKKLLCILGLAACVSAQAATPLCPIYEYEELKSMTSEELKKEYFADMHKMTMIAGGSQAEFDNCDAQLKRITRIEKSRGIGVKK